MTAISIAPDSQEPTASTYRAVSGNLQSVGKTPGEALDALTRQLNKTESSALVLVLQMQPDQFFTAAQQQRLAELMQRWRAARDAGSALPAAEQDELKGLTEAELKATAARAAALVRQINP